jgi:hypothetical protein
MNWSNYICFCLHNILEKYINQSLFKKKKCYFSVVLLRQINLIEKFFEKVKIKYILTTIVPSAQGILPKRLQKFTIVSHKNTSRKTN